MCDITWYNDLVNPISSGNVYDCANDSANALFSCETFEVIDMLSDGPGLVFGAFAGHSIEFKVGFPST